MNRFAKGLALLFELVDAGPTDPLRCQQSLWGSGNHSRIDIRYVSYPIVFIKLLIFEV